MHDEFEIFNTLKTNFEESYSKSVFVYCLAYLKAKAGKIAEYSKIHIPFFYLIPLTC